MSSVFIASRMQAISFAFTNSNPGLLVESHAVWMGLSHLVVSLSCFSGFLSYSHKHTISQVMFSHRIHSKGTWDRNWTKSIVLRSPHTLWYLDRVLCFCSGQLFCFSVSASHSRWVGLAGCCPVLVGHQIRLTSWLLQRLIISLAGRSLSE